MKIIEDKQITEQEQRILDGLNRAVAAALERKRRLGQFRIVRRDGRPQRVEPDQQHQTIPL